MTDTSRFLSREALLKRNIVEIEIPEIEVDGKPGIVHFRQISAKEILDMSDLSGVAGTPDGQKAMQDAQNSIICRSLVDADGKRMFNDDEIGEVINMPIPVYTRLSNEIRRLIEGVSVVGEPTKGKDSTAAPSGGSPTN